MLFRNLNLSPDLLDFVRVRIESGRYESTRELLRAALLALHREEGHSAAKSPTNVIAESDPFRRLWEASAKCSRA